MHLQGSVGRGGAITAEIVLALSQLRLENDHLPGMICAELASSRNDAVAISLFDTVLPDRAANLARLPSNHASSVVPAKCRRFLTA